MAEYIEREAVLAEAQEVYHWCGHENRYGDFVPVEAVCGIPASDVAPVVHGRWLHVHVAVVDTTGDCSACNTEAVWRTRRKPYSLCPNCGARMDGE